MTKNVHFILITLIGLAACDDSTRKAESISESHNVNHFSNVIQAREFGDTIRIEIEKRGDTLIKHYIDLKGVANDNFDNSFNVICTYHEKPNDTTIKSTFYVSFMDFRFYFDRGEIISYCDSIMKSLTSAYDKEFGIKYYDNLKYHALTENKSDIIYLNVEPELIDKFNCSIVNIKTKEKPKSILIENYQTEFSGGINYYLLTNKGDTIELFHKSEYIK